MRKCIPLLSYLLICLVILAGCTCKHTWIEADCVTAKTCSDCDETEGEPLGHSWANATCEVPKTCTVCTAAEGEALGHSWTDATCEAPKTCTVCTATEGEPLPHTFTAEEPTVIEDIPSQTYSCSVCGFQEALEGEAFVRDLLCGSTWQPEVYYSDGVPYDATGAGHLTFGEGNAFTCDLGDILNKKGMWILDKSFKYAGDFFHYFVLAFEDGTRMEGTLYTGPAIEADVFYIFDSDADYFAFIKADISALD